jgi:cell division protein FtsN
MPRIAVAVAVVALIAFSIGFNTVRYTVVWDMVGGSSHPSQPSQPSPSATPPQSTTVVQNDAADRTAVESQREATGYEDPYDLAARQPQQSGPTTQDSPAVEAAEPTAPLASTPQLARAEPADARQDTAACWDPGGEIRRLPPVDQVAPSPADRRLVLSPQDPIPIYPGSGS